MHHTIFSAIAINVAVRNGAALALPPQPDIIPSIHPVTGPAPPEVPAAPHGAPRPVTDVYAAARPQSVQSPSVPAGSWPGWAGIQNIFSFGDSYSNTGFDYQGAQPSPEMPLGNPAYPGATSSNGPNYIDYLTTTYNASAVRTYDLAFGGATVDSSIVPCYNLAVPDFRAQVNNEFFPYYVPSSGGNNAPWAGDNTLFTMFFGINDISGSYPAQNATINGDIIATYSMIVDQLYNAGARNFLFLNVPPIDRTPGTTSQGMSAETLEASDVANFNGDITNMARNAATYADATVFLYDTNALFNMALDVPGQFPQTAGLRNLTGYCDAYADGTTAMDSFDPSCGVPVNEYFWLNGLHPTFNVHGALADGISQMLAAGTVVSPT